MFLQSLNESTVEEVSQVELLEADLEFIESFSELRFETVLEEFRLLTEGADDSTVTSSFSEKFKVTLALFWEKLRAFLKHVVAMLKNMRHSILPNAYKVNVVLNVTFFERIVPVLTKLEDVLVKLFAIADKVIINSEGSDNHLVSNIGKYSEKTEEIKKEISELLKAEKQNIMSKEFLDLYNKVNREVGELSKRIDTLAGEFSSRIESIDSLSKDATEFVRFHRTVVSSSVAIIGSVATEMQKEWKYFERVLKRNNARVTRPFEVRL